jgi:hypothetical protein
MSFKVRNLLTIKDFKGYSAPNPLEGDPSLDPTSLFLLFSFVLSFFVIHLMKVHSHSEILFDGNVVQKEEQN